jgi:NADPH2:quinone reductase
MAEGHMKAARIEAFGDPLALRDMDRPTPGPGEVLLRIAACGLNFADLLMMKGTYQDTPEPPFTLGMEVAGTVEAHGEGVTSPVIGARVAVFAGAGGLAEYGVFDAARCVPIPGAMPFQEAAGFLIAYGTSHLALTRRARLQQGERLLVLGAGGGVGLTAVELGATMGAEVIAVARGADKLEAAKSAGAHHLLDARSVDLKAEVKARGGADVVYDAVGGAMFKDAMRATNPEGRILVIGFASGEMPQIAPNHLLVKNIDVIGFYWGGYMRFGAEQLGASLSELMQMYEAGRIKPHIGATRPLSACAEALDLLKTRGAAGKIVVTMNG